MPYRRMAAAAAVLLAAAYVRFLMPVFYGELMPPLRAALSEAQAALVVPEAWEVWLHWD